MQCPVMFVLETSVRRDLDKTEEGVTKIFGQSEKEYALTLYPFRNIVYLEKLDRREASLCVSTFNNLDPLHAFHFSQREGAAPCATAC